MGKGRATSRAVPLSVDLRRKRPTFLVFGAPSIGEEEINEVVDTLRSGWIGFGPKCLRFEREFADYTQAEHAISVGSCTAGLHLALVASGIGPGDEVVTSPLTFSATVNVIEHVGATPVFVDVDRATQNVAPRTLEAAITPRTRAIIPVHFAGRPCDMDAIGEIAGRNHLTVIEDAAHAIEASWRGRKIGSISRFTVFSFYATKNLTTAEGGMVTTSDEAAADLISRLRLHGLDHDAWGRYSEAGFKPYDTTAPGFKYNLTDLQASLGLHQLRRLEANLTVREDLWRRYDAALADLDAIEPPHPAQPSERHARHLYTILLRPEKTRVNRFEFINELRQRNIGTGVHFMPVHLHSYYRQKYGFQPGDFPVAEEIGDRTVSLPLSAGLSHEDVDDVVEAIRSVLLENGQ